MTQPLWKRLVEDLTAQGYRSPHLDRLRERLPRAGGMSGLREIELEIAQEMAASLGRAAEKVDVALLELELLGRAIDEAPSVSVRAERVAAFNAKREVAAKALWELRVHREAIGLRRNEELARTYPIPAKRV